jgi:two-component system response regulator AlgR
MDPLRVFIVDDEAPARSRLRVLLADLEGELPNRVVGEAENGAAALAALAGAPEDMPEVMLVDIRMPAMDGIELARHLARLPQRPRVVFVTAYDQYAVQAFELNAVDYLLKPVRAQRLRDALVKARRSAAPAPGVLEKLAPEGRRHLSCSERGRILLVPVGDILYLRAELKYVTARTREREYLLEESLTQLEQEYPRRFLRVHRNCLVARGAVAGFERAHGDEGEGHWLVLLKGHPEKLPVSRRQWSQLRAEMGEK